MPAEVKARLVGHGDVQGYKAEDQAAWLAACVDHELRDFILGGPLAVRQTPDADARQRALAALFVLRGGSDGSEMAKCRRALQALHDFSPRDHLPASRLLLHRVIQAENIRALEDAKGSRGGGWRWRHVCAWSGLWSLCP